MKKKNKYKILKRFKTKTKAEKFLESLGSQLLKPCCKYSIVERKWIGKDKKRYYVRELVGGGTKCVN